MGTSSRIAHLVAILVVSLAVLTQPSVARVDSALLRKLFDCPPCIDTSCPMLSFDLSCEPVLEPGVCACCYQCAKQNGDNCGINSGRCGKGLVCRPLPGDPDPFRALLDGTAVCVPSTTDSWVHHPEQCVILVDSSDSSSSG